MEEVEILRKMAAKNDVKGLLAQCLLLKQEEMKQTSRDCAQALFSLSLRSRRERQAVWLLGVIAAAVVLYVGEETVNFIRALAITAP